VQNAKQPLRRIRLTRSLTWWQAVGYGIEVAAAVGVLVLLVPTVAVSGILTPLVLLLAALLVVVNGWGYAALAHGLAHAGGAYTLIRNRLEAGSVAFVAGWGTILATLGLAGLLAQGAAQYLGALLVGVAGVVLPTSLLAGGLVALAALVSGLGGLRRRGPFLALPLLLVLLLLVGLAIPQIAPAHFQVPAVHLDAAIAPLIALFVSLEILASRHGELRRQAGGFGLALVATAAGVTVLGSLVAAAFIGVLGLEAATGPVPALSDLAAAVAGPAGRFLLLGVSLFALTIALIRTLTLAVRKIYRMTRDGFWPAWLARYHTRRGVPLRLVLLAGLLLLPLVWLPTDLLAQVAGLLYLVVLFALNLTLVLWSRRRAPAAATSEPGKAEGAPSLLGLWGTGLVLVLDLLAVTLWAWQPVVAAAGSIGVGTLLYLFYGRRHRIKAQEGLTVFGPADEHAEVAFRVLVPVANPSTADDLLRLAGRLARAQEGEVLALQVIVVPETVPLEAGRRQAREGWAQLEQALAQVNSEGLPIETMTRVARSVAQGIVEAAAEERADLVLLGWGGPVHGPFPSPGPIVDEVLRDVACDVLVMRGGDTQKVERILVPAAGGPHARVAARQAFLLGEVYDAKVTLLYVQVGPATPQQTTEQQQRLAAAWEGLVPGRPPELRVVTAPSVAEGIIQEADEHDLVLIGVSEENLLDRLVFGSIPRQVAAHVPGTIFAQAHRGLAGRWTRRLLRALRNTLPTLNAAEQQEVHQNMVRAAHPGIDFFVLIVLSCIIAALGLLLNSPAVVIGAMLVAPLMSPIMAFSLGLIQGELRLIRFATEAVLKGTVMAVLIAALIGLLYPLKTATGEMLARSQPTLIDLGVALASGAAGAYALGRKEVSAALPGVAIAAALMPPLATVGLSLAMGDWRVAGGALLLFTANIAAITLAGGVVFLLLGMRPQVWGEESRRQLQRRLTASLLTLLVVAIPLGILMGNVVRSGMQERAARAVLDEFMAARGGRLVDVQFESQGGQTLLVATVQSASSIAPAEVERVEATLSQAMDRPVQLELVVLTVVRSGEP
jgi:uncharacterized hydrophobic protein (TIGR00271 family)